ncbi:MAG: 3-phosphoshikimate 1-carboxyvinyltransferase [Thermoleophilia bacterium]|nr:3-phosphoshikimate 1-carboxyvinyltransferase [Thermoleophilia bacterium]
MTTVHVAPANSVQGALHLPGDKSMSHRALLLALVSTRPVRIENLALGEDVAATLAAVEQLGATVVRDPENPTIVTVTGVGLRGIQPPADGAPIDCRNAGTLARLLTGLLVGQPAGREFTLVGDDSLSSRPMARIADPLKALGAKIETTSRGTLPLKVTSVGELTATVPFELEVASAQVQSAILLAGMFANGRTTVVEPAVLRDHTERMLKRCGVKVHRRGLKVSVEPVTGTFELPDTFIPADPSAAAAFVTAATVLHGSLLRLPGVLEQPGRRGFVDILEQMGAHIAVSNRAVVSGEPVADLEVKHATVSRTFIEVEDVARMIDELPLLALVGHFRRGEFVVRGAEELRAKESNRIDDLELAFRKMGVSFQGLKDGYIVRGSSVRPDGGRMDAAGDHRLAMLGGIVGLVSRQGVTIDNAECVDVSFPGFFDVLDAIAVRA